MKTRLSLWLVLLLSLLLAAMPAQAAEPAETAMDLLESFGMTEAEAEAFAALAESMQGEVTEDDLLAMLEALIEDEATGQALPGQLVDGVYTDPGGYSMRIPEGWALQETLIGPAVVISGLADSESSFAPTITITVTGEVEDDFLAKTQEEIDALLSVSLPNYLPIALDDFEFLDIPAREMVCMYGANEASMLMQYQLHFNNQGKAFVITMTTLAEEATHEQTLDTYDAFLAEFLLLTGEASG